MCVAVGGKFNYENGQTYMYRYEADVVTFVRGSDAHQSRFHLTAKVHVDVHTPCDWILRVTESFFHSQHPLSV